MNDVTFRVVLTQVLIKKWDAKIVDIYNAFLNGELEHEIYMTIPEEYVECVESFEEKEALKLEKAIYGLVQVARQFLKKFEILWYKQVSSQVKLIHAWCTKKIKLECVSC